MHSPIPLARKVGSMEPKAFISYSWTDDSHQERVRHWADRLLADGVDIILDVYDLKEGDDKYVFMERMVTDPSVSHVLVICDQEYKKKADDRTAGVGTESQIISKEVYEKVEQSKFIPIVSEIDEEGNPYLPAFLKSRIWVDFSSLETENKNWEQLVRLLHGKPQYVKPKLGKVPSYIINDAPVPTSGIVSKFNSLKQAIQQNRKEIIRYNRRDFLDACVGYADELRIRERPTVDPSGEKILEDSSKLKLVRDPLVDWVLLESEFTPEREFSEVLIDLLERLRALKSRPFELDSWKNHWFEAHTVFVYEMFLYFVAALLKMQSYKILHEIYTTHYLISTTNGHSESLFEKFDSFHGHSEALQSVLAPEGRSLYSPAAELLKRHADRTDLPFSEIIQAELLTLLMSFIVPGTFWYPGTLHYHQYGFRHQFFIRAAQHKHFAKLAIVTGVDEVEVLRSKVTKGNGRMKPDGEIFFNFYAHGMNFLSLMNIDQWDSLK